MSQVYCQQISYDDCQDDISPLPVAVIGIILILMPMTDGI